MVPLFMLMSNQLKRDGLVKLNVFQYLLAGMFYFQLTIAIKYCQFLFPISKISWRACKIEFHVKYMIPALFVI